MRLEQGKLVSFPQSTEIRKKSKQSLTLMDIYCKCRSPLFENDTDKNPVLYMIECAVCEEWFHEKCERVPNIYFRDGSVLFVNKGIYSYIDSFIDYF